MLTGLFRKFFRTLDAEKSFALVHRLGKEPALEDPSVRSLAYDLVWPDDHPVLKGEREVARLGAHNFGGAAWLPVRRFCQVLRRVRRSQQCFENAVLPTQSQAVQP